MLLLQDLELCMEMNFMFLRNNILSLPVLASYQDMASCPSYVEQTKLARNEKESWQYCNLNAQYYNAQIRENHFNSLQT